MRYIDKKLTIEKVKINDIVKKYGTPTYCYSYGQLKENINSVEKNNPENKINNYNQTVDIYLETFEL